MYKGLLVRREGECQQVCERIHAWFRCIPLCQSTNIWHECRKLTRERPVQNFANETLAGVAAFRERTLILPSFHETRLRERDGIRVDVFGLGQQWLRGADERADECVCIGGIGKRL